MARALTFAGAGVSSGLNAARHSKSQLRSQVLLALGFSNNLQGTNQGVPPSWQPGFAKDACCLKTATRGDTEWRHERRHSHSLPGTLCLLLDRLRNSEG